MTGSPSADLILAHGLGARQQLPVPLALAMYAGAVAVLVSFLALATFWTKPRLRGGAAGHPLPRLERVADSAASRWALRLLGFVLLAAFLISGWLGPDDYGYRNPAPTWIYVWFWVGLVPVSLLFGRVWRRMNPVRTVIEVLQPWTGRLTRPLPERLGYWPATLQLLFFVWMELVYEHSASPPVVAGFVTIYLEIQFAGGLLFGPTWFDRCDGFEVYASMIARASVLGRRDDGKLVLRNPLDGLSATPPEPDLTPVVILILGSTAFDGLSRTSLWSRLTNGTGNTAYLILGTLGLAGTIAAVAGTYAAAVQATARFSEGVAHPRAQFAHSVIPIAIGYTIAHYFSFALFQGQQGILLANDPLVRGWDLFGLTGRNVDYGLMSNNAIAFVQVTAIVLGHIAGVTAAHDRAVVLLPERLARRGQYPMLAVMVLYTITGIALISGS